MHLCEKNKLVDFTDFGILHISLDKMHKNIAGFAQFQETLYFQELNYRHCNISGKLLAFNNE